VTVHTGDVWMGAKLWWPTEGPDDKPDCYRMRTTVVEAGRPIDVREDLFGFKEITYNGRVLLLNNVPQHFWNYQFFGNRRDPDQFLDAYYKYHIRGIRLNGFAGVAGKARPMDSLAWLARNGIPTRQCLNAEGMMFGNAIDEALYWDNMARHVSQALRVLRNYPNIMYYSLGNELFLINGMMVHPTYEIAERRGAAVAEIVKELDPQRRGFYDGGGDLGGLLEMCAQHYTLPRGSEYPWRSYDHIRSPEPIRPRRKLNWRFHNYKERRDMFLWNGRVPLILGEVAFYASKREKAVWLAGPDAYESVLAADDAYGYYTKLCVEGFRWQGGTEICLWSGIVSQEKGAQRAFPYQAAFMREHNCVHYPDSALRRTVRVFNDTHLPAALELTARAVFDGEAASGQKRPLPPAPLRGSSASKGKAASEWRQLFVVPAGRWMQGEIVLHLPSATKRREGRLELSLKNVSGGGKEVFTDSEPLVLQPVPNPVRELNASSLTVWDPQGKVTAWLSGRGQAYRAVKGLGQVEPSTKALLVGPNALPPKDDAQRAADVKKLNSLASAGVRVLVLEQEYPLQGDELPAPGITEAERKGSFALYQEFAGAVDADGTIAFPVALAHAIFRDIDTKDFYTWEDPARDWRDRRDLVFTHAYLTPKVGMPLVQAMGKLAVTPMLQLDTGKGTLLLSQLLIGTKLGLEPTADRLLMNMLRWAGTAGQRVVRPTFAVCSDAYDTFLSKTGLRYSRVGSLDEVFGKSGSIIVVEGTPENLGWLARHADQVRRHCEEGGWLMIAALRPEALAEFNKLVAVRHRMRPFRLEKVLLMNKRDPLLFGLSSADLEQYQNKVLASWAGKWYRSATVFSYVVDYGDVAPFAEFENWEEYPLQWQFDFPEAKEVKALELVLNPSYHYIKELGIIYDGNEAAMQKVTLEQTTRPQRITFDKPRRVKSITLRVLSTYPGGKTYCGIDNVRMIRVLPQAMKEKVLPLSRPAGLVKYPVGKGGIVLNQLDYQRDDRKQPLEGRSIKKVLDPDANVKKKVRLTTGLLVNMGAEVKKGN